MKEKKRKGEDFRERKKQPNVSFCFREAETRETALKKENPSEKKTTIGCDEEKNRLEKDKRQKNKKSVRKTLLSKKREKGGRKEEEEQDRKRSHGEHTTNARQGKEEESVDTRKEERKERKKDLSFSKIPQQSSVDAIANSFEHTFERSLLREEREARE